MKHHIVPLIEPVKPYCTIMMRPGNVRFRVVGVLPTGLWVKPLNDGPSGPGQILKGKVYFVSRDSTYPDDPYPAWFRLVRAPSQGIYR